MIDMDAARGSDSDTAAASPLRRSDILIAVDQRGRGSCAMPGQGRGRVGAALRSLGAALRSRRDSRATRDVRVSRSKKKGPMGPGRKRTKKTARGGDYVPEAWDQVLFSDFFSPSGFSQVCPAFL